MKKPNRRKKEFPDHFYKPSKWVIVAKIYFVLYLINLIFLSLMGFILGILTGFNLIVSFVFINVLFGIPLLYILKDYWKLGR